MKYIQYPMFFFMILDTEFTKKSQNHFYFSVFQLKNPIKQSLVL